MEINPKREELARYGLKVEDFHMTLISALGGENITYVIEKRERFPLNISYPYDFRQDVEKIKRIYIKNEQRAKIPLAQIADMYFKEGPSMIRNENGRLASYVYINVKGRDVGSYIEEAKKILRENLEIPAGYSVKFSGQYEYIERVKKKMLIVLPLTIFLIFILLYINTGSYIKTLIVLLAVPFSLIGAIWLLFLLKYNLSVGVLVGIIAPLGVDAETGVFMLLYLDLSYREAKKKGRLKNLLDLKEAIYNGAVKRIRPKVMTVLTTFVGLLPIMWAQSHGLGANVMKRIAAPMVGGLISSFLMELLIYPAIFFYGKEEKF